MALTEYQKFLKENNLQSTARTAQIFRNRQAREVNTRGTRNPLVLPEGPGLNNFRVSDHPYDSPGLASFKPENTFPRITQHSYIEGTFNQKKYRIPFFCNSLKFGYGSTGEKAQSKFNSSYYPVFMNETPISISAQLPSEDHLADFSEWVRTSQTSIAAGREMLRLYIPAAKINALGFIPSFIVEYKEGFEPAPEFSFDFVIQARDAADTSKAKYSSQIMPYFISPQDKYWKKRSQEFTEEIYRDIENEELNEIENKAIAKANSLPGVKRTKAIADIANLGGLFR